MRQRHSFLFIHALFTVLPCWSCWLSPHRAFISTIITKRTGLVQATSSSDLKREDPPKKRNIAHRLKQAAARASLEESKKKLLRKRETTESSPIPSLQQLTQAIDRQLARQDTLDVVQRPARDSMIAVVSHNQRQQTIDTGKKVAIILAKPLQNDLITVEYAARIQRLVYKMKYEQYTPDVICFMGELSKNNRIPDADAGYMFFRHLLASLDMQLPDTVAIDLQRCNMEHGGLQNHLTVFLQQLCLPVWSAGGWVNVNPDSMSKPRKRIPIHFSLISSDYHLCQLHDIHVRSPKQSPLRSFEQWTRQTVQVTYEFVPSATISTVSADPAQAFLAKHYKSSQRLLPVVQNLRGVVENREFFQRDNYRVLVSARRSLVRDMEQLYHSQPSLQSIHRLQSTQPLDIILEQALLSLGRCLDLVRPAGLLTGTVSEAEWRLACQQLEQAVVQLQRACETDRVLDPHEWGLLPGEDKALHAE